MWSRGSSRNKLTLTLTAYDEQVNRDQLSVYVPFVTSVHACEIAWVFSRILEVGPGEAGGGIREEFEFEFEVVIVGRTKRRGTVEGFKA